MVAQRRSFAIWFFAAAVFARIAFGAPAPPEVQQYHPIDLRFKAEGVSGNPFQVDFSAEFLGPDGKTLKVPGFYDGDATWVIRFAPPAIGSWSYRTASNVPLLNAKTGKLVAVANTNELVHGRLRVDPQHPHHFVFEDGAHFFLLGFECDWLWALDAKDAGIPNLRRFVDILAERGFNHITMNIFAYDTPWAKGNRNQWDYGPPPIYPWAGSNDKPDFSRLNLAFWKHYDKVVDYLFQKGIVAHLMLRVYNKMVKWPPNGSPEDDLYYRYIVARYAAYPNVIWDFSKEAQNEKDTKYKLAVIGKIKLWDPYHNLVTVHDDDANYDNGNYNICDFRSDQRHSKWGDTILAQRAARRWPVLNIEYGYERGVENLATYGVEQDWQEVLRRTWEIYCAGGYCNYYYSNTAWDLIKWNPEPPGWKRYRILRDFFESTRWWGAEPHNDLLLKGNGWCLADPGREYVVFVPRGGAVVLRLVGNEKYSAIRFDPYTGEKTPLGDLSGGDRSFSLPAGHPWVLWVTVK